MAWTLDKSRADYRDLQKAEQEKFDVFQDAIHNEGLHPREAAQRAGETKYEQLQGDQYQIRLGGKNRATFRVDNQNEVVTILQVGGHT